MMDCLLKGIVTAGVVACLLIIARGWGQRIAGVLTGLPTVTGPALVWLHWAQGPGFAAEAAIGCVAAGAACALFGLGYALTSRRARPLAALLVGTLLAALSIGGLAQWQPDFGALMLTSLAACVACTRALHGLGDAVPPVRTGVRPRAQRILTLGLTACVSGVISGALALWAGHLGAFWSGVLASAPLIAAVVAFRLHLDSGSGAVAPFMRGYLGGLIGRNCFAGLFGLLVAPARLLPALMG